jgi:hypothetical protein
MKIEDVKGPTELTQKSIPDNIDHNAEDTEGIIILQFTE